MKTVGNIGVGDYIWYIWKELGKPWKIETYRINHVETVWDQYFRKIIYKFKMLGLSDHTEYSINLEGDGTESVMEDTTGGGICILDCHRLSEILVQEKYSQLIPEVLKELQKNENVW